MSEESVKNTIAVTKELSMPESDALVEILSTIRLVQNFLNDQVMQDLSRNLLPVVKLLNAVVSTDLIDILERSLQDPELDKALLNPPKVGMVGFLGALRDNDAKKGLGILVELIKAIGRASTEFGVSLAEMEAESPFH